MIKVLAISNLYPNSVKPHHGIFTENRLRNLVADTGDIEIKVIAPIASFPFKSFPLGPYSEFRKVPQVDMRHGIEVHYPRYVNIPKFGMMSQPERMAKSLIKTAQKIKDDGFDFDVIDCFYFYPDGVAAAIVAEHFNKPLVITAYGNDISLIPQSEAAARKIVSAAQKAKACSAVCQALKTEMVKLGVDETKIHPILHGVDLEMFKPSMDRNELRSRLNISGNTLLSVGHLIERKGFEYSIESLVHLPGFDLLIAGDGPDRKKLQLHALKLGVADRVRFLGRLNQSELKDYFAAVDAFVLMSSREGIPNVIMESLACGTPVVASSVWGIPEVVTSDVGRLVGDRSPAALALEVQALFEGQPLRNVREHAEQYSWQKTSHQHRSLYDICLS